MADLEEAKIFLYALAPMRARLTAAMLVRKCRLWQILL